jgi:hypothetical protein
MDSSPCAECRAIYRELQEAYVAAKVRLSGQTTTPQEIGTWIQGLDEEECAQMRETSDLWAAWRRWQEHRALTGHWLSLLGPPNAISNPN